MDGSKLFTVIVLLYSVLLIGGMLLASRKHHWTMTLVRLVLTGASALLAVPLSVRLSSFFSEGMYRLLGMILPQAVDEWLTAVPLSADGVRVLGAMLASPILFLLLFLIVRFLLSVICSIVEKILGLSKKRPGWNAALALPVGAVHGALIAFVTLIPLCGFLVTGAHVAQAFIETDGADSSLVQDVENASSGTVEDVGKMADECLAHPVVKLVYGSAGQRVFDVLTERTFASGRPDGGDFHMKLETELCGLTKTAGYGVAAMDAMQKTDFTEADKQVLYKTADSFFASDWLRYVATDTVKGMATEWQAGRPFIGQERPVMDDALKPTFDHILRILASETPDTLHLDIHTILDVWGDLMMYGLITENPDYTDMVQKLGQDGRLTSLLAKLETNERLSALAADVEALSIRLIGNMLGIEALQNGEYDELMGNVASTLDTVLNVPEDERNDMIRDTVKENFGEYGYDVPDDVINEMSDKIITDLGSDGKIESDELKQYITDTALNALEDPSKLPDSLPSDLPVDIPLP